MTVSMETFYETNHLMQVIGPNHEATVFDPINTTPDMIHIESIARALSHQCRFGGHVLQFYSVAEHSVLVSKIAQNLSGGDYDVALWGLLHDASEAYIVDIPRPLKNCPDFKPYYVFENNVMKAICEKFELAPPPMPAQVKAADEIGLALEARDNLQPLVSRIWAPLPDVSGYAQLRPLWPVAAEALFMDNYHRIQKQRRKNA